MPDQKEGADDSVRRSSVSVDVTEESDQTSAIDLWPDSSIDPPIVSHLDRNMPTLSYELL